MLREEQSTGKPGRKLCLLIYKPGNLPAIGTGTYRSRSRGIGRAGQENSEIIFLLRSFSKVKRIFLLHETDSCCRTVIL